MASIMLFPTVATHQRLPHLSKEPKESKAQKDIKDLKVLDNRTHLLPQDNDHHPSSTIDVSKQALSLSSSEGSQLVITASNTLSGEQKLPQQHGHKNAYPQDKANMSINTTSNNDLIKAPTMAATPTTTTKALNTGPLVDIATYGPASDNEATESLHGNVYPKQGDQTSHEQEHATLLQGHHQHHAPQQQQMHPLNMPHGSNSSVTTPLSALPPPGVSASASSSSSSSSLHESKMIKTALHDAFGCLYQPAQHTHQPSSSTLSSTASTPRLGSGRLPATTTSSLRSGEVTPLLGISPRASPMLRPHLGTSAPITPLELTSSADGHLGGGYFGLHGPSSHSNNMGVSGTSSKHLNTHHHHHLTRRTPSLHQDDTYHHYHHVHRQYPQSHGRHNYETDSPKSLSRRSSLDFNLNPVEHPVLCSLHALNQTHPHPSEHYHPHLGHDLGHDCVPITPADCLNGGSESRDSSAITVASAQTSVQKQSMPNTQPPIQLQHPPMPQKQQQHPVMPGELLSTNTYIKNPNDGKSPFPMDSNCDGPHSIGLLDKL
ncbi:hypothetical protein BGZ79_007830 [Entomortierella chlamydospora]|nr:hypothetical protein BGZ79_007830 [Entomortierella chlamydospora]